MHDATRPLLCKYLRPADVGADSIRPRATNSRPYKFYRTVVVFCNTPFYVSNKELECAEGCIDAQQSNALPAA